MRGLISSIALLSSLVMLVTACPKQEKPADQEFHIALPNYRTVKKDVHTIAGRHPQHGSLMAVINGCPAVAFTSENTTPMGDPVQWHHTEVNLYFGQAQVPIPTQSSDWTVHQLSPGHAACSILDLVEHAGKPVLFYIEAGTGTIMAAATVPHPQSDEDWEHYVLPPNTYPSDIAEIDGRLAIALLHKPALNVDSDDCDPYTFRDHDFKLLRQLDPDELDPTTWSSNVFSLENEIDTSSLRLANDSGLPVFSYATDKIQGMDSLFFWRATTPDPVILDDWEQYVVRDDTVLDTYGCCLTVYNHQPVIVYISCRPTFQLELSVGQPNAENTSFEFSNFTLAESGYISDSFVTQGNDKLCIGVSYYNQGYVIETDNPSPHSESDFSVYPVIDTPEDHGVGDICLGFINDQLVATYMKCRYPGTLCFVAFD